MVKKQGILSRMARVLRLADAAPDQALQDASSTRTLILHRDSIGSSGTENYGGYFSEEYLKELTGKRAADVYDKMRRSDPQISMVLTAVKNPLKSAAWDIEAASEDPIDQRIAETMEFILFDGMDKTWRQFLHEALSMIDFGHSVFEITHKVVMNHPKFGTFNGIRSFGFRSQRTIERWNLDRETGKLRSVDQYAYGDLQRLVEIPAPFLVVFALDKEGDNYEGISRLRSCYGPWLRKQTYLKLMAIGVEKNAVPTPIGKVPENKENSEQFENFKAALEIWTSHQSNYITLPQGWDVEFKSNDFDPEKVQKAIEGEDKAIVKAFLANFLELGMSNSGGSYALSFDLSDFFLSGLEHIGAQICEALNPVLEDLTKMNFGERPAYPKLKASGISDKAGKELAEVIKAMAETKVIIPDNKLEDHVRERYGLPAASLEGQRKVDPTPAPGAPKPTGSMTFSERREIRLAETPKTVIVDGKAKIKTIMQEQLGDISDAMISQIMGRLKSSTAATRLNAIKDLTRTGVSNYRQELIDALAELALKADAQARREVPKAKDVRLAGGEQSIKLAEWERLSADTRKRIQTQADLIVETQMADLEKAISFRFISSEGSTDSDAIIEADMTEASQDFIEGASVEAGSGNIASFVVNEARNAFFFDDQTLEEIEAFTFMNGDPVSPICQDLAGTTFSKDDPEAERYYPPLHHNCKSYLVPVLKGSGTRKEIELLRPSDPKLESSITLGEGCGCGERRMAEPTGDVQSVVISKDIAKTLEAAKKIAQEFGAHIDKVDETEDSYRFRQLDPGAFASFRTFNPKPGVALIYGRR